MALTTWCSRSRTHGESLETSGGSAPLLLSKMSCSLSGTVKHMLPPAEKPDTPILFLSMPRSSALSQMYRTASAPSSTAVGNGYSGASL